LRIRIALRPTQPAPVLLGKKYRISVTNKIIIATHNVTTTNLASGVLPKYSRMPVIKREMETGRSNKYSLITEADPEE